MNQRTCGRNRALALSACCAVLCALCALLAGRYEVERRGAERQRVQVRALSAHLRGAKSRAYRLEAVQILDAGTIQDLTAERDLYRRAAEDLSRKLKHYEAAYPETEAARRENTRAARLGRPPAPAPSPFRSCRSPVFTPELDLIRRVETAD
jgi:hypothetical protein